MDKKKLEISSPFKFDVSYTQNMAADIQASMEKRNKELEESFSEIHENRQKMQEAIEQTAINTSETNVHLQNVIVNQNDYITILKEQIDLQNKQLELNEQQLAILKNIFSSTEDGVAVEQEILKLIQEQIDSNHPLWDFLKDKGGDVAVAGITAGAPVIYNAIRMFLLSKGINLP